MNVTPKKSVEQESKCVGFDTLPEAIDYAKSKGWVWVVQSYMNGGHGGTVRFYAEAGERSPFLRNYERIAWGYGEIREE